jgi:HSP20 family protein
LLRERFAVRAAMLVTLEDTMALRDLIPWSKDQEVTRFDHRDPFLMLHREMNRLFDDVFRWFVLTNTGPLHDTWPRIEVTDTGKAMTISAELPGLTQKDVQVEIADGVLSIRGERRSERSDEGRYFTERFYGAFERQIPVENVEEDKVKAEFRDGVLTVTLPKTTQSAPNIKRITINGN